MKTNTVSSLSPHILLSTNSKDSGYVSLVNRAWSLRPHADDAFVFPTQRLAQRYADYLATEYAGSFTAKAAPFRSSHLPGSNACFFCGCIEAFACPNRCSWAPPSDIGDVVEAGVCSTCVEAIRAELEAEHASLPNDPTEGHSLSLGEAKGLNYGADAWNAEMARSGDHHQADHLSRIAGDVVHAIARQVEGAH